MFLEREASLQKESLLAAALVGLILLPGAAWAAHPLITDDPETQGAGKFQLEANGEWATDKENTVDGTVREKGTRVSAIFSAGIQENVDLVLTTPYQWVEIREPVSGLVRENSVGDTTLEVKWRLYERGPLKFAFKPGFIVPTGNDEKELGTGKVGYSAYLISGVEKEPWTFLLNVGYIRNENNLDERQDLWQVSFATEYEIVEHLELVADLVVKTNTGKGPATAPAFLIVGLIYKMRENLDLALGVKYGLNKPETDLAVLPGVAIRF